MGKRGYVRTGKKEEGNWVLDWMRRGRWAFGIAGGLIVQTSMMMSVSECFVKNIGLRFPRENRKEKESLGPSVSPKEKKIRIINK